ncbi:ABC transporter ATP-binding protein [Amphiplicatus metriothermophilus]|uniref:Iron(III) transport system ATP-binding protein n=1 Tax=Amphiplicatus metriothermophilus TaxID=1519374 RepID=A0A239PJQ5_9PROT|nr:ABC transporter ATP-binding protein [Amphiplicatus metriothermophilus]MBB5517876.1 iron(III) transport system ATP-binding protein [Amphiplicatus metriothermophilus]SNT67790.1 iron(III) transport system ATP-binding protein [Amphiplicatus metriothermophilus]
MSLVLADIVHRYGRTLAVDRVSLEAERGEIVCLFGPSGCGKTTLLRLAAGLERLQAGRVALDGALLAGNGLDTPAERRPIGFVFQDYVLFPHLTAIENVAFALNVLPRKARRARAEEELARVGLDGLGGRYPHELSGGQQQRVALARAFARGPRAVFLDEPFSSIDAVLRRRLRDEIRRMLKERGAATLLVTHDPEEALALGDRIAVMKAGRIVEAASPRALFEAAKTPEGASLFPGAQQLFGIAAGGMLTTPFGAVTAPGLPDGPALAVVQAGGARGVEDPAGTGVVVDCRFAGPDWRARLRAVSDPAAEIVVVASDCAAPGARFAVRFDPARARIFPRPA